MIADWKTFDSAPKDLVNGEFVGQTLLISDRWGDVFTGYWSEDLNRTPHQPGWYSDNGDAGDGKPMGPDMSDYRWDYPPAGYIG